MKKISMTFGISREAEVTAQPSVPSRSILTDYARDERDLQANMLMRATA